jgi:hypothetical protein
MMRSRQRREASGDAISRRDFLEGLLIASGGAAVGGSVPLRALAVAASGEVCGDAVGLDPRALRGGNLPSSFLVAHWLRDQRLSFQKESVTLARGCDDDAGTFPIIEHGETYDVVIIGGGLAGLSAAFHLLKERPAARLLIVEAGPTLGGNAGRDEAPPLPGPASTAGAYCATPGSDWLRDAYSEIGVDWDAQVIEDPVDSFYFDEHAPGVTPDHRGWNLDTFDSGLSRIPCSAKMVADLQSAREAILALGEDGVTDPADDSDPRHDDLSTRSFAAHLEQELHCDPAVSEFFTAYTLTAFGGTASQVDAHSVIAFLASEFQSRGIFTFPGGTSELARRFQHWLLRDESRPPRIELDAMALRVEPVGTRAGASVVYVRDRGFRRVFATRIVIAAPAQVARHLVDHVSDAARREAWSRFHAAPIAVANVVIRRAAPLLELGLGYSQSWWGGRRFVNYTVADWIGPRRADPDRETTLTFYGGCAAEPGALGEARMALLQTPFSDYENSLREDLARLMRGADFDFDRDVRALYLYRWGHSMLRPPPGWLFGTARGPDGRLTRESAPRRIACAPLGPIDFAGQHVLGAPSVESALASGRRAAQRTLASETP